MCIIVVSEHSKTKFGDYHTFAKHNLGHSQATLISKRDNTASFLLSSLGLTIENHKFWFNNKLV